MRDLIRKFKYRLIINPSRWLALSPFRNWLIKNCISILCLIEYGILLPLQMTIYSKKHYEHAYIWGGDHGID